MSIYSRACLKYLMTAIAKKEHYFCEFSKFKFIYKKK